MALEKSQPRPNPIQGSLESWTHLAWVGLGLYAWAAVLAGAVLPQIRLAYQIGPAISGLFVAIPSVGFTVAGLIGGFLSQRIGLQRLLAVSAVGMALSLGVVALAQRIELVIMGALLIGFSGGLLETGSNGLITSLYGKEAAPQVNRLHIFYGIGSFLSPLIAGVFLTQQISWQANYAVAGIMAMSLAFILYRRPTGSGLELASINISQMVHLMRRPIVLRSAIGSLIFIAAEMGLSSWLVTYLQSEKGYSPAVASLTLSIFWLAMLAGRYLNSRFPGSLRLRRVIWVEAVGSCLAIMIVLSGMDRWISILGVVLTGLFMAGMVPTLIAYASQDAPQYTGSISGLILSAMGIGMLIGPGTIGLLMAALGLKIAIYFVLILLISVVTIFVLPEKAHPLNLG